MGRSTWVLLLVLCSPVASYGSFEREWSTAESLFYESVRPGPLSRSVPANEVRLPRPEDLEEEESAGDIPEDLLKYAAKWNTRLQLSHVSPGTLQEQFNFVVLGDSEPGRFVWSRFLFNKKRVFLDQLMLIQSGSAEFILHLGDMVSRGIVRNFRGLYADLEESGVQLPFLTVLGNHDRNRPHGEQGADLYLALFGPQDYSFDKGAYRFVALDSSLDRLTGPQLDWLDRMLDTDKRTIIFTHMPPARLTRWTLGLTGIKEGEERFLEILSRRKASRVYVGHIHGFGTARFRGVPFVLSGGGGSPLYPTIERRFHHYLVVQAGPSGLRETVHPLMGKPFPILWPGGGDFIQWVPSAAAVPSSR